MNLCENARCMQDKPVLISHLVMPGEQIMMRIDGVAVTRGPDRMAYRPAG
jgi:hypothetical protein